MKEMKNSENIPDPVIETDNIKVGAQNREKVLYREDAIVRITYEGDMYLTWGSGCAIGPNKILTSAHVIKGLQYNNPDGKLIVYIGEHNGYKGSPISITKIDIHPEYKYISNDINYQKINYDLAVITVDYEFNEYFEAYPFDKDEFPYPIESFKFSWVGYPSDLILFDLDGNAIDKDRITYSQWLTESKKYISNRVIVYIEDGKVRKENLPIQREVIRFCAVSTPGQSGSPLIFPSEQPRSHRVIGALSGGPDDETTDFTLLTTQNYQFVLDALRR